MLSGRGSHRSYLARPAILAGVALGLTTFEEAAQQIEIRQEFEPDPANRATAADLALIYERYGQGVLFGPAGADARILALGQAYHRATDWPARRPPDFGGA